MGVDRQVRVGISLPHGTERLGPDGEPDGKNDDTTEATTGRAWPPIASARATRS